jgi:6-pyruvoyltetrahydropterin/6-carboxytetrahydropterin synthase
MVYRICKSFEIESGHMLSKHPGRCRFPHGHSRRVEVVLSAPDLDENDMVCDFAAIKLALRDLMDRLDHAMAVNSADPLLGDLKAVEERVVIFQGSDPTTEVLARHIYDHLEAQIRAGTRFANERGHKFGFRSGMRVERVRVGETSSSWAEYARET